jgi:hypothetical protein
MRVIPCCPLPYSDGRFNELFAVRTICGLYHRRPRRLAEGLKRADTGPTWFALARTGVRAIAVVSGSCVLRSLSPPSVDKFVVNDRRTSVAVWR